jgi:serine phosphatase RsbU (regulator of sigma subunit)
MEVAREVQERLLPNRSPDLRTLEVAGLTLPARQLGGDYYDFLEPGAGRLGIALGDISGKGVSAALMMASLQASLRSHYAAGNGGLERLLRSVNGLFHECTAVQHYATLFLAEYDDHSRRLRYANCGHLPPLLLRCDGRVERLGPTAMILGAFREWECGIAESTLAPGDVLLLFSDGLTEACRVPGEDFGDERLLETLRACRGLPLPAMLRVIVQTAREFGGPHQRDDMTLVVARARHLAPEPLAAPEGRPA